jgi:hypothetical protein
MFYRKAIFLEQIGPTFLGLDREEVRAFGLLPQGDPWIGPEIVTRILNRP